MRIAALFSVLRPRASLLLIVFVCLATSNCSGPRSFVPRVILSTEGLSPTTWLASPNAVVFRVRSTRVLGKPITVRYPDLEVVELLEVNGEAETIVWGRHISEGGVSEGPLTFYHYAHKATGATMHDVRIDFVVGGRFLVFLRPEAGYWRTMFDDHERYERIWSGRHRTVDLPTGDPWGLEGNRIAYVMVTPGQDFDAEVFARELQFLSPYRLSEYATLRYSVILFKQLRQHSDRRIRTAACAALADDFYGFGLCGAEEPRNVKRKFDDPTRAKIRRDHLISELELQLRSPLEGMFSTHWSDQIVRLQYVAEEGDTTARTLACKVLARDLPTSLPKHCAHIR